MRIGMLGHLLSFDATYRQAGVSRYIQYLIQELPAVLGPDELVVYTGRDGVSQQARQQFPDTVRWSPSRWPTGRPEARILWEQLVAPLAIRKNDISLVHAPVNILPLGSRIPGVVTIHDLAFLVYPDQYPGMKQRYLSAMTRRSVEHAQIVVTVSEHTRLDVIKYYDVDPTKVRSIPNGLDTEMLEPVSGSELEQFRRKHDLPETFILFVGTLQPRKNLRGLLQAYAQLPEADRMPLYVVGGEGWMYRDIYDEVQALGIVDNVVFPGYVSPDELRLWYSAATIFVYPSFYEGFGLPVLEAMACGAPVVASQTSSLPEVVGDTGLLIDPERPEEISIAIKRLIADTELRTTFAARGRERAEAFSWKKTASATAEIYREAAEQTR